MKKIKMLVLLCLATLVVCMMTACNATLVAQKAMDIDNPTLAFAFYSNGQLNVYNYTTEVADWQDYEYDYENEIVNGRSQHWEDRIGDIKKVIIGPYVGAIGAYNFNGATNLEELVIGPHVTSIGENAFRDCYNLKKITIDAANTNYKMLDGCLVELSTGRLIRATEKANIKVDACVNEMESGAFYGLTTVKTVDLSQTSITEIAESAFRKCSSLTTVTLPDAITDIGDRAFFRCVKLSNFDFGAMPDLKTIGDIAFYGCSQLKKVELSSTVTKIGTQCFAKCEKLTEVIIDERGNRVTVGSNAFYESDAVNKVFLGSLEMIQGCDQNNSYGYLVAVSRKSSAYYETTRNIKVYIPKDLYAEYLAAIPEKDSNVGRYLFNEENYKMLETTETYNEVECVVLQSA